MKDFLRYSLSSRASTTLGHPSNSREERDATRPSPGLHRGRVLAIPASGSWRSCKAPKHNAKQHRPSACHLLRHRGVVDYQHRIAVADQPVRFNKQFRLQWRRVPDASSDKMVVNAALRRWVMALSHRSNPRASPSPSAEDRLPKSLHFAESDVIIGVVRARSVHEVGYGHKWDWEA